MTVFGKILVIVNLVFSLVVGALIIMAYVANTNWKDGYDKLKARFDVANANAATYAQELERGQADSSVKLVTLQKDLDSQKATLQKENEAHKITKDLLAASQEESKKFKATAQTASEELRRRDEENKKLEEVIVALNKKQQEMVVEGNKLRDRAVAAEIRVNSLTAMVVQLEEAVRDLTKQLAKIKANGGAAAAVAGRNPPPEQVEGLVKTSDPRSGMVTLTIGSDSGLAEGHTLEVFSMNPAKWKGTLKIISVGEKEAVARPTARPLGEIQQGDRVASKILGS